MFAERKRMSRTPAIASPTSYMPKFANVVSLGVCATPGHTTTRDQDATDSGIKTNKCVSGSSDRYTNIALHHSGTTQTGSYVENGGSDATWRINSAQLEDCYRQKKLEREEEENMAALERQRLEEVLRMCREFEEQEARERAIDPPRERAIEPPKSLLSVIASIDPPQTRNWTSTNKIRTNGSLTSPIHARRFGDVTKSDWDQNPVFDFDRSPTSLPAAQNLDTKRNTHETCRGTNKNDDWFKTNWWNANRKKENYSFTIPRIKTCDLDPDLERNTADESYLPVLDSSLTDLSDTTTNEEGNTSTDGNLEDDSVSLASIDMNDFSFTTQSVARCTARAFRDREQSSLANETNEDSFREELNRRLEEKEGRLQVCQKECKLFNSRDDMDVDEMKVKVNGEQDSKRKSLLRQMILDLLRMEEKAISELETEIKLLRWEYNTVADQLQREKERMANIKYRQMELLMQAGQEKEEARRQLEMEKGKLKEMEERHTDNQQKCDMYSSLDDGSHGSEMDRMLKQESDALEIQKKLLDDLEFHLLELETRREEEREPVVKALSAEHAQISKTVAEENERLRKILQQKTDLVEQFKSDIDDFESERQLLVDSFKTSIIQDDNVDNGEFLRTPHSLLGRLSEIDAIDLTVCSKQDNLDDTNSDVVNGSRHNSVDDNFSANSSPTKETPRLQTTNGYAGTNGWSPGGAKHEVLKGSTSRCLDRSLSTEGYTDPFEDNQRTTMINYESSRVLPSLDYICPRTNGTYDSGGVQFTNGTQDSGVVKFRQNSYRAQCRPLTRYLPIRDRRDLDLRQFIEGCGHNLDENDDVRLSSTCCRGYLSKMGTKFRTWNRRWFVLDRTLRTIVYYLDRNETKARGLIRFSDIEDVFVDHMKTARKGLSSQLNFCLKTRKRTFYLAAVSGETMRIWIDVMFTGAEGYNEYM